MSALFTTQFRLLTTLTNWCFEHIMGKGENAGNQYFLLFPQCFLPYQRLKLSFKVLLFCCLCIFSIWTGLRFCHLVKTLTFQ